MPLVFWPLVAAGVGALAWNQIDDSIIDPITGTSTRPVFAPSAVVAFAAGAVFAIIAKKKGWL